MPTDSPSAATTSKPVTAYLVVVIAIVTTSSAAILIRFALLEDMPPVMIVAARLLIATAVLTPIALRRYKSTITALSRSELLLITISGICLALHFTAWVSSLQHTTVLVSVVVVSTGPIWVAILEVAFLRIRLSRLVILGLLVALIGGALIGIPLGNSANDLVAATNPDNATLTGALLALLGALTVSVYMLIGRKLRATLPVVPYVWLVYGIASLCMIMAVALTATPVLGYSNEGYLILLAMGLVPQLIGHSSLNYLLERFPAALVSMFSQLEPIGSALMALLLFRELPPIQQIIGSMIIIIGVLLASLGEIRPAQERTDVNFASRD